VRGDLHCIAQPVGFVIILQRDGILAQIPMGRWSTPEEAVKAVCFLLSDGASYVTGQSLAVNGGFHISL